MLKRSGVKLSSMEIELICKWLLTADQTPISCVSCNKTKKREGVVSGHKGIKSIGAGTGDLGVLPTHETSSLFGVHYGEDVQPLPNTPSVFGRSFIDKHYPYILSLPTVFRDRTSAPHQPVNSQGTKAATISRVGESC